MPHRSRTPAEAIEHYRGRTVRHPRGESPITWPHMHVGADVRVGDRWLGKVHLPTSAVGLERVVAMAIDELGAKPLRDDWERLIGEAAVR
jgi:hypothetical protein